MRDVRIDATFESWQQTARRLLSDAVAPGEVRWRAADSAVLSLFGAATADTGPTQPGSIPASQPEPSLTFTVPRRFLDMARHVAAGRDPARWALLYRVLWRVTRENRRLLELGSDPDVQELTAMEAEARSSLAGNAPPVGIAASIRAVVPPNADLSALRAAALTCTACDLYKTATQVVFGSGPSDAKVVFIGEQPGDQ